MRHTEVLNIIDECSYIADEQSQLLLDIAAGKAQVVPGPPPEHPQEQA